MLVFALDVISVHPLVKSQSKERIQLSPVPEGHCGELTLTVWVSSAEHVKQSNSFHLH